MDFKNEMLAAAAEQLSIDYACLPTDFLKSENTITFSRLLFGRRRFLKTPDYMKLATMGYGTVCSANKEIYPFMEELLSKVEGPRLFDGSSIALLCKELMRYGFTVSHMSQYYLASAPCEVIASDYPIKLYEQEDIASELYPHKEFSNALMFRTDEERSDVLAAAAFDGERIIAMAGASNDSERFWQIGIDVLPEYRGRGLASALVSYLTQEVFCRGAIPYYGTWWGNIASRSVARRVGFYPAWSELNTAPVSIVGSDWR